MHRHIFQRKYEEISGWESGGKRKYIKSILKTLIITHLPPVTWHERKSSWPSRNGPAMCEISLPCASNIRGSSGGTAWNKTNKLVIYTNGLALCI